MKIRPELKYVRNNMTSEWLIANGFQYNRLFSDEDNEVYTYRFSVYKYEGFAVLECELKVILGESRVIVDVYDYKTINKYAPFYYLEYDDYSKMLKVIWDKINKEFKKLEIVREEKESDNGSKNQKVKRKRNNPSKRK